MRRKKNLHLHPARITFRTSALRQYVDALVIQASTDPAGLFNFDGLGA